MDHLDQLEQQSVFIFREAFRHFERLCMLWSIGKDSTVLLWLARKAFFGHVPFPLVHIDTSYKLPEMIRYRDTLAMEYKLQMVVGQNKAALDEKDTFPDKFKANPNMSAEEQAQARTACCGRLKTDALAATLHGTGTRMRLNLETGKYEVDGRQAAVHRRHRRRARRTRRGAARRSATSRRAASTTTGTSAISRPSSGTSSRPTSRPGTHVRIHPLLDWTELNIWEYIKREIIPTVSLYYDQGDGTRYRSLGCGPCQTPDQEHVEERRRHHHRAEERKAQEHRRALRPPAGRQTRSRRAAPQGLHVIMNPRAPRAA